MDAYCCGRKIDEAGLHLCTVTELACAIPRSIHLKATDPLREKAIIAVVGTIQTTPLTCPLRAIDRGIIFLTFHLFSGNFTLLSHIKKIFDYYLVSLKLSCLDLNDKSAHIFARGGRVIQEQVGNV